MMTAGELKKGSIIERPAGDFLVTEYQRIRPMDGKPIIRMRLKNIKTEEETGIILQPDEPVTLAPVLQKSLLYQGYTEDSFLFLDSDDGESFTLSHELVGNALKYIKKGECIKITSCRDQVLSMELPPFTILKVIGVFPEPNSSSLKLAAVESGAKVRVPTFVEPGDSIKIDTRSGKFLARM